MCGANVDTATVRARHDRWSSGGWNQIRYKLDSYGRGVVGSIIYHGRYRTDWLAEWREMKSGADSNMALIMISMWTSMRSDSETTWLSWISSKWIEMSTVNDASVSDVAGAHVRSYRGGSQWSRRIMGSTKINMIMPVSLRVFSAENKLVEVHPSLSLSDYHLLNLKDRSAGFLQI